jgi:phage shock protein A
MGAETAKLSQLRPVTFKLKSDAQGTRQYGLIAEEVAKVYPELVIRDEQGRIDGVRYDELAPMLLNEVQQQQKQLLTQASQLAEVSAMKQQLASQASQLAAQASQLADVKEMLVALELQAKVSQLAMR